VTGFAVRLRANRFLRIGMLVVTSVLPLTPVVSGAIVVMTALRDGWRTATIDTVAGVLVLAGLLQLTSGDVVRPMLSALALWGGALLGGNLLRSFRSVDLAVQALVLLSLAGLVAATLAIPDAQGYWQPFLEALIKAAGLPQVGGFPPEWLGTMATLMHGVFAASLLTTLIPALMLALWLDRDAPDRDAEEGQWRRRFLEFRLGRVLSLATFGAAALVLMGALSLGGGALLVLGTGLVAQGLAIVHWTAEERSWPRIWPLGLYGALVFGAPAAGLLLMLLATVGLLDNAFGLRRRRSNVV
jgi:hypothetical protein